MVRLKYSYAHSHLLSENEHCYFHSSTAFNASLEGTFGHNCLLIPGKRTPGKKKTKLPYLFLFFCKMELKPLCKDQAN